MSDAAGLSATVESGRDARCISGPRTSSALAGAAAWALRRRERSSRWFSSALKLAWRMSAATRAGDCVPAGWLAASHAT